MSANERRAEIMQILTGRRKATTEQLARELGVTSRTIRSDVTALTSEYPIESVRGACGCVKLADWYWPHKYILSR